MKKVFRMKELDCANCAAKMEKAIAAMPGVISARVNFMTQKLTLEASEADFDRLVDEAAKAIRKVEPDCILIR